MIEAPQCLYGLPCTARIICGPGRCSRREAAAERAAMLLPAAAPTAPAQAASGGEVVGWLRSGNGYAPVFVEQAEPPHPLTREEALIAGWRPLVDASAPPAGDPPAPAAARELVEALRSALERVTSNYRLTLARKPVRDVTETLAECDAALAAADAQKAP